MADEVTKKEPSMFGGLQKDFARSFAAAKAKLGPQIQKPGTETLTTDELTSVGMSIPKGDSRLKGGFTLSNIDDKTKEKIEALRKKTYAMEDNDSDD